MVWRSDCRGGIWRCLAGNCVKVEGRGLDQSLGSSPSSRQMDQPLGPARPVDQPLGTPSRWVGKLVVSNAADLLACPRKLRPL
jgi:hypothetical protein